MKDMKGAMVDAALMTLGCLLYDVACYAWRAYKKDRFRRMTDDFVAKGYGRKTA